MRSALERYVGHRYCTRRAASRRAALEYRYDFQYRSKPSWETYKSLLGFAQTIQREMHDLHPRDMIDIQSFIWVQGSDEYSA